MTGAATPSEMRSISDGVAASETSGDPADLVSSPSGETILNCEKRRRAIFAGCNERLSDCGAGKRKGM